ncbi:hypothetical protein Q5H93_12370 [Hymenobacter sp. ASUV-10]|uniref:Uncharacterized protein n=1 Tax=Hymenobacter aranciens TaxID=3063996 RepID=A0ABT9BCM5_9BACT|nr:hypothetical protein [Hymenobacter sp. ASUV-10]MDO7875530.1 hypothetical protein [Hymenobacter sp. ASUV-10]
MTLFGKKDVATLTLGAAMLALVGKDTVSAEEAGAANEELSTAGITGAQLLNQASFNDLSEKAGRVDAAEKEAADAKASNEKLSADLKAANDELATLRKKPGATHTTPRLAAGQTDVEADAPDAHQQAIDELPHNQALDNHPIFGGKPA